MRKIFTLSVMLLFCLEMATAQEVADSSKTAPKAERNCEQQAIGDLFRKKDKAPKTPKKLSALILPNISSNPTNGFILGVGGAFGWRMGPKENTSISAAPFTAAVTSKSQLITFVKPNIYTKGNQFFLQGDSVLFPIPAITRSPRIKGSMPISTTG